MANDLAGTGVRGDAAEVAGKVTSLPDLAPCRTRGNVLAGEEVKDLLCRLRLDSVETRRYGAPTLAVMVDEPREGDKSIEHDGKRGLLRISGTVSAAHDDGAILGLEETPRGAALVLVDPPGTRPDA